MTVVTVGCENKKQPHKAMCLMTCLRHPQDQSLKYSPEKHVVYSSWSGIMHIYIYIRCKYK